ncbi:Protein of unknown function [Pyronema omphalodes CBS 100304]|uniref:Uncharacterized protein n=1 Tax=Pyronema omphalodes (strain CBS 100304) TaxID=1076935 RepID=U4L571_PYROM|nr:Protein of unknown function [Pyronema omphalodes CBS 100304]
MSLFPRIPKLRPASRIVVYRPKQITLSAASASRSFSSKSQKRHDLIPEQEFQYPFTPLPVEFALGRQIRKYLGPRLSPMMMTLYLTENDLIETENAKTLLLNMNKKVKKAKRAKKAKVKKVKKGNENRDKIQ